MSLLIPPDVVATIGTDADGKGWLANLEDVIEELSAEWGLTLEAPFVEDVTCSWVARCTLASGARAIFKVGWPHIESRDEIIGLLFWRGNGFVRLLESDVAKNAMLLEQCSPGTKLRQESQSVQDEVVTNLLRKIHRAPPQRHSFRPLSEMIDYWIASTESKRPDWFDPATTQLAIQTFRDLLSEPFENVVLATDLHAGNILKAERETWLAIDPKPFVGDASYDITQHLLNGLERLRSSPEDTIKGISRLLQVDDSRVRRWIFARLATQNPADRNWLELAKLVN